MLAEWYSASIHIYFPVKIFMTKVFSAMKALSPAHWFLIDERRVTLDLVFKACSG